MKEYEPIPPGKKVIIRRWFIHPKSGTKIFPKNGKYFRLVVDDPDYEE